MPRLFAAGAAFFLLSATLLGQAPEAKPRELSDDEKEFVELCTEMQAAYTAFLVRGETIKDPTEAAKFVAEQDPASAFLARMEAMEEKHRGTHLGLMIARRLTHPSPSLLEGPRDASRRRMLLRLSDYAGFEELPELLRFLDAGAPEPAVEECLRSIIASDKATEGNRLFASFMLARWSLAMSQMRPATEGRLAEIKRGVAPRGPFEEKWITAHLALMPSPDRLDALQQEATEILRSLSESKSPYRQPVLKAIDRWGVVVQIDKESTQAQPLISQLAAGVLFKESHLRPSKPAPELELTFTTGEKWSLADQKGKCVIIQFSFKGCGPCEAMYPALRELAKEYGDRLSIVSIMADTSREETVEAVASGKITWGAHFDGKRGPICTEWAVKSFPTVYVFGPDGKVAEADFIPADQLKARVAELLR